MPGALPPDPLVQLTFRESPLRRTRSSSRRADRGSTRFHASRNPSAKVAAESRTRLAWQVSSSGTGVGSGDTARNFLRRWLSSKRLAQPNRVDLAFLERVQAYVAEQQAPLRPFLASLHALDEVLAVPQPEASRITQVLSQDPVFVLAVLARASQSPECRSPDDLVGIVRQLGPDAIWEVTVGQACDRPFLAVPGQREELQALREKGPLVASLAAWAVDGQEPLAELAGHLSGLGAVIARGLAVGRSRSERPRQALVDEVAQVCGPALGALAAGRAGVWPSLITALGFMDCPSDAPAPVRRAAVVVNTCRQAFACATQGVESAVLARTLALDRGLEVEASSLVRRAGSLLQQRDDVS